jgi:Protein of unknown function (DUF2842)/Mpv17 / PMP22 family
VGPRTRKALASVITLIFLVVWLVVSLGIAAYVPDHWRPLFFAFAGIAWGVPLFPLFTWAEHGTLRRPRR